MRSLRDLSWLCLYYHQYITSKGVTVVTIPVSQKSKRLREQCMWYFYEPNLREGMNPLHSHSIHQNSVTCLHQTARKAIDPRLGNESESTHIRRAEESSQVQGSKDWGFSPGGPFARATGQISHLNIRIAGPHCFLLHKIISGQDQSEIGVWIFLASNLGLSMEEQTKT